MRWRDHNELRAGYDFKEGGHGISENAILSFTLRD
jgi:hypothetical protein